VVSGRAKKKLGSVVMRTIIFMEISDMPIYRHRREKKTERENAKLISDSYILFLYYSLALFMSI
jgi:hypothetical protein